MNDQPETAAESLKRSIEILERWIEEKEAIQWNLLAFDHVVSASQVVTSTPIWIFQYHCDRDGELILRWFCLKEGQLEQGRLPQRFLLVQEGDSCSAL